MSLVIHRVTETLLEGGTPPVWAVAILMFAFILTGIALAVVSETGDIREEDM